MTQKVHIVRRDESWHQWDSIKDYEPLRYEATLINVVRVDGKWVGIVAWGEGDVIQEVNMTEIEEWHDFDRSAYSPPGW